MSFNIGDKVRVIRCSNSLYLNKIGIVGEIRQNDTIVITFYGQGLSKLITTEEFIEHILVQIELKIQKDPLVVVYDNTYIDDRLRGKQLLSSSKNGGYYSVWSNCFPTIGYNKITLMGKDKHDDNIFNYYKFKTIEERDNFIKNINLLIDDINNNYVIDDSIEIDFSKEFEIEIGDYKLKHEISSSSSTFYILKKNWFECIKAYVVKPDKDLHFETVKEIIEFFDKRDIKIKDVGDYK